MARDDRRPGAEDRSPAPDLHRCARARLPADRPALVQVSTWILTVRAGPRVERQAFDALEPALDALAARVAELVAGVNERPPDTRLRRYGPEQQITARAELAGPERRFASVHAGVDVHGDGSTTAYLGRVRRRPLDQADDEEAITPIRRALIEH